MLSLREADEIRLSDAYAPDPAGWLSPEIAVVVLTGERPLRTLWMLNALEEQTLDFAAWEAVLPLRHDHEQSNALLREHKLVEVGHARCVFVDPLMHPGEIRNAAWRLTGAPWVAFVDTEMRLPAHWLERVLQSCQAHPTAILEGPVEPDPTEGTLAREPFCITRRWHPPTTLAPSVNVVYPRALLERLGGCNEQVNSDELSAIDLAARAVRAGALRASDPELTAYASVRRVSLRRQVRAILPTRDLPWALRRYPELRATVPFRILKRRSHAAMATAVAGVLLTPRLRGGVLLAAPWVLASAWPVNPAQMPGRVVRRMVEDLSEIVLLAWGSVRHHALML